MGLYGAIVSVLMQAHYAMAYGAVRVPSPLENEAPLKELIFNQELSAEFRRNYEIEFGSYTGAVETSPQYSPYGWFDASRGGWLSLRENALKEERYVNFMVRRLLEYHSDKYAKSKPQIRNAYELQEKMNNYALNVAPDVTFKSMYALSSNKLEGQLKGVLFEVKASIEMEAVNFGPSTVKEFRMVMDQWITPMTLLHFSYTAYDGIGMLIWRKMFTPYRSISLVGSTYFKERGYSIRESLGLIGYNYHF